MEAPSVKIVVAAHKPYWMPSDDSYVPVQVGATGKPPIGGFRRDDEGENISEKNPRYCELTALYWAWKNLDAAYVGLAHYRRHFAGSGENGVLLPDDIAKNLRRAPVVLPKKRHYCIESIESHYAHTFDQTHIDILRAVLAEKSPEVLPAFDEHMKQTSAHIWNMAIMRKDVRDAWCSWLFPILEAVEVRIDFTGMSPFEARVVGRLSERLLDPWLAASGIAYTEVPVRGLEKTNWLEKGGSFLRAKFCGKRYTESF